MVLSQCTFIPPIGETENYNSRFSSDFFIQILNSSESFLNGTFIIKHRLAISLYHILHKPQTDLNEMWLLGRCSENEIFSLKRFKGEPFSDENFKGKFEF